MNKVKLELTDGQPSKCKLLREDGTDILKDIGVKSLSVTIAPNTFVELVLCLDSLEIDLPDSSLKYMVRIGEDYANINAVIFESGRVVDLKDIATKKVKPTLGS